MFPVILWLFIATAVQAFPRNPASPCPNLFRYDTWTSDEWTGHITLLSDFDLHGIWTRLQFSSPPTEIKITPVSSPSNDKGNFEVVSNKEGMEYLVKDKDSILKANKPLVLEITVKHGGYDIPELNGFRLNAKTVCPEQKDESGEVFTGDFESMSNFFEKLKQEYKRQAGVESCGKSEALEGNLVGDAKEGTWPWHAAIYSVINGVEHFICDATLISSNYLITAAHCVTWKNTNRAVKPENIVVYLNRKSSSEIGKAEKMMIEKIIVYPGYMSETLLNDLALISLQKRANMSDTVRPICLPTSVELPQKKLQVVGYQYETKTLKDLAAAQVQILSDQECAKLDENLSSSVKDNQYCAVYDRDMDACVGTSGSSVAVLHNSNWELQAIVNLARSTQKVKKCTTDLPIVLLNIRNYIKWIMTTMLS